LIGEAMETIEVYYENTLHQFNVLSSDEVLQTVIDKDGNIILSRVLNAKELLKQLSIFLFNSKSITQ
jgi:hypothetical protein